MTAIRNKVKPDTVLKNFWRDNQRFADVFNTVLFNGKQVLKPEDLKEADTNISSVIKFNNHAETVQRILDVVRKTADGTDFIIWSLENQEKIHYAMPQKVMLYDGMDYEEQIRNLWKQRMECQKQARRIGKPLEHLTAAEYLSRFRKNDRLIPIISLVFYYGSDPWDGPQDLYDMFRLEGSEEEKVVLEKYLPNYKINLVDVLLLIEPVVMNTSYFMVGRIFLVDAERMNEQEIKYFSEDLQVILTMLKYRHEKNELKEYINKQKRYFQNVDYETSQVIKVFLNMKSIPGETDERKVNVNMCEALEEMYNDAIKEGMEAGTKRKLIEQVMKKVKKGLSAEEISDIFEEDTEIIKKICIAIQTCEGQCTIDDVYEQLYK